MKDVLSLAVFSGKVLCLVMFVSALKPQGIAIVEASGSPAYCNTAGSRSHACGSSVFATLSAAFAGTSP